MRSIKGKPVTMDPDDILTTSAVCVVCMIVLTMIAVMSTPICGPNDRIVPHSDGLCWKAIEEMPQ